MNSFGFIASTAIAVVGYALIAFERVNRAVVALLGAGLLVVIGVLSQADAIRFIDFDTLGLLAGMMIIVSVSRKSGLFIYLAIRAAQSVRGSPAGVLAALTLVTALLSAFVNNVTVVLLIVPVTFVVCGELRLTVYPFLVAEIFASNIGGTATLIGDPPNILISSATGLTFNDFATNLAPLCAVVLVLQLLAGHLFWGMKLKATAEDRLRVMKIVAREAIEDRYLLICSLTTIVAVVAALVGEGTLHLQPATIAVFGAAILLFLENLPRARKHHTPNVAHALMEVDWITLFFIAGLFVMIGGLVQAGVLRFLGGYLLRLAGRDVHIAASLVLWGSAVLSAFVDNIPYVTALIPIVKGLAPALGGERAIAPVWWALALGAGLGGNGTLIGASANLTVAALAEKNGVRFNFMTFMLTALPMMLASIAIANAYLILRYF